MTGVSPELQTLDLAAGSVSRSALEESGFSARRMGAALLDLLSRHDMQAGVPGDFGRQSLSLTDWIAGHGADLIARFDLGADAPILASLPRQLFAQLFERAFGGDAVTPLPVTGSPAQARFANRFGRQLSKVIAAGWADDLAINPECIDVLFDGDDMEPVPDDRICIVVDVPLAAGGETMVVSIALPADMIAAMRLPAALRTTTSTRPSDWRERLRSTAGHVHLPLRSILARPEIPAARLLSLRVGDLLPIAMPQTVPLLVGPQLLAYGRMGESNGCAAIRIEHMAGGLPS